MLAFLLPLLAGLSVSQWLALIPQIIKAVELGITIYKALIANSGLAKDEASAQAAVLLGKAVTKLISDTVGAVIPLPHKMTPEEETVWMSHQGAGPT